MGNQGNAGQGWREIYSIVHSGALGDVTEVHTYTNRPIWPQGNDRPEGGGNPPDTLDWEAWIGPAPMRPYRPEIQPFKWRGYYDFGCGALGDMACHTMNAMFQVMKPEFDLTVEPVDVTGRSNDQFPKSQIIKWVFAKAGACPGFTGFWYDGNRKPEKPAAMGEHNLPNTATMFVGTKGVLVSASDYNDSPVVYVDGKIVKPTFQQMVPPSNGGFQGEFLKAVAGETSWDAPMSNFMYAGKITAIINMGTIAERVGKKIAFSAKTMKFDDDKATAMMRRVPREGWEKAYKV
jgi:predicted dehydrogenase